MSTPVFTVIRNARVFDKPKNLKTFQKSNTLSYNRKEKSLEELSRKFLILFIEKEESMVSLDKITDHLGVERRRIYDIINILESLNLVSRKGKNNYKWNGFQKIYQTIKGFQDQAVSVAEIPFMVRKNPDSHMKREKSLKILSIGFLNLFIHWKRTMPLEEAAKKLSSSNIEDHKIKTKIRRLYDIANVFKSLGLIKKTLLDNKKPAFNWVGLSGLDEFFHANRNIQQNIEEKSEKIEEKIILNPNLQEIIMKFFVHFAGQKAQEIPNYEEKLNKFLLEGFKNLIEEDKFKEHEKNESKLFQSPKSNQGNFFNNNLNNHDFNSHERNFVTPIIKKTLTIIHAKSGENMNFITPSTEKRPFLINETPVLKDSTNLIKRKPLSYNFLDISNKSSFKKIKRFSNEKEITDKENLFPCF